MYIMKMEVMLSDTDATGQVYYARPLEWLEWCRVKWFQEKFGNFMEYVERTGVTFFPSKASIEYKKPVMFGDKLSVEMKSSEIKKASFTLNYAVKRGDEIVLAADILMVCFDRKNNKFGRLEGEMLEHITALSEK